MQHRRAFTLEPSIGTGSTEIDVDPDAFTRGLWNLLDNAVKYSGSSRSISVAASVDNDAVTIAVRDGGIGIPRQEQEQIFKKFVRGSSSARMGSRAPVSASPWCSTSSRRTAEGCASKARPVTAVRSRSCCLARRFRL
jgi:hypothetical protein